MNEHFLNGAKKAVIVWMQVSFKCGVFFFILQFEKRAYKQINSVFLLLSYLTVFHGVVFSLFFVYSFKISLYEYVFHKHAKASSCLPYNPVFIWYWWQLLLMKC